MVCLLLSICLPVCLDVCLSSICLLLLARLLTCLPVCLHPVCLFRCRISVVGRSWSIGFCWLSTMIFSLCQMSFVGMPVCQCLSLCLSFVYMYVYLAACSSFYPSVNLPVCACLSVYVFLSCFFVALFVCFLSWPSVIVFPGCFWPHVCLLDTRFSESILWNWVRPCVHVSVM